MRTHPEVHVTGQIQDILTYRSTTYDLAGIKGGQLFDPGQYGLAPYSGSTACWRGFQCHYAVYRRKLVLKALYLTSQFPPPALFGRAPNSTPENIGNFGYSYSDLRHPVPYSGGLLIARGFIQELYVHMGFEPAWKYSTVYELAFQDGVLTSEVDRSQQTAGVRERMLESGDWKDPTDPEAVQQWIERQFNRDYAPWSA